MITLVRSELHRMTTIRSSWVSLLLFTALATTFGAIEAYWWALFAGMGSFALAVLTVTQHYQHRTITLLYLAHPKRGTVLIALVLTAAIIGGLIAAVSGISVLVTDTSRVYQSATLAYRNTLLVVPVMAVFGAALAVIVRRAAWIFTGFGLWFIIVEGLIGQMKWPLPVTSFLDATKSQPDPFSLMVFGFWTVAALAVAVPLLSRDLIAD